MIWPPLTGDWQQGIESYRMAAESAGAGLFPVAEAMRAAWNRDPELDLLDGDAFHPAPKGTYLAAVVIVAQLLDRSPIGLAHTVPGYVTLTPDVALLLQEVAREAIEAESALGEDPA